MLRRQERRRDAIRLARATQDSLPGSLHLAITLGHMLLEERDMLGAAEAFERATGMPNAPREAWIGLAEALVAAGRPADAEAVARRGIAVLPAARELRAILGQLLLGRGEADAARDALAEAIEQDVESAGGEPRHGRCLVAPGPPAGGAAPAAHRRGGRAGPAGGGVAPRAVAAGWKAASMRRRQSSSA